VPEARKSRKALDAYFNYFTEIERHYQTRRESFTLLSTLDWVLIETWKDQGIPLEIVLRGMDRAFSKAKRPIGSLAYCARAVGEVLEETKNVRTEVPAPPRLDSGEVRTYLEDMAEKVRALRKRFPEFDGRFRSIADSVTAIDAEDLRSGESALNALEDKLLAVLQVAAHEAELIGIRQDVDRNLAPIRSRMTTEQLHRLDQQYWKRALLERFEVPRLSLFYMI
jgi:hypothetical protein